MLTPPYRTHVVHRLCPSSSLLRASPYREIGYSPATGELLAGMVYGGGKFFLYVSDKNAI